MYCQKKQQLIRKWTKDISRQFTEALPTVYKYVKTRSVSKCKHNTETHQNGKKLNGQGGWSTVGLGGIARRYLLGRRGELKGLACCPARSAPGCGVWAFPGWKAGGKCKVQGPGLIPPWQLAMVKWGRWWGLVSILGIWSSSLSPLPALPLTPPHSPPEAEKLYTPAVSPLSWVLTRCPATHISTRAEADGENRGGRGTTPFLSPTFCPAKDF